ncbi:hypothetical protein QOZ95_005404 [Paenibacillus brasilensis]|uniref:Uncharacterized protein n=1 Tax=Paenibacillus brasilensis TaxID=128574 RepID=A0ABU0L7E4_9BACL|nr:hypothetical protein [Paenibacillus brasilensis]MDQ0497196.1 hypothetical protein [Paenibacillus brasilensis]
MSLGYDQIQIYPYVMVDLEQLVLTKKINEHTRLYFTGVIPEDLQDSYVETTEKNTVIQVSQRDESGESKPLFSGIALSVEVKVVRDVYYLEVEAISHTYRMDIKQRTRSFQYTKMTIPQMLEQIGKDYEGLDVTREQLNEAIGLSAVEMPSPSPSSLIASQATDTVSKGGGM